MASSSNVKTAHSPAPLVIRDRRSWLDQTAPLLLILALTTLAAFARATRNELVNWDDEQNLVHNENYKRLTWSSVTWMLTTTHGGHYQPLSWLSFWLDHAVWGGSAFGFHITNLLLHVATAALFYFVAREFLCRSFPPPRDNQRSPGTSPTPGDSSSNRVVNFGALAAALLFAVHPLRVESVAWATERRDVLSGAWMMLAVLCYVHSTRADSVEGGAPRRRAMLACAWVCFVFSLLSKATGLTLPLVLLILDAYPLRRVGFGRSRDGGAAPNAGWRRVAVEKLAFAAPAALIAVVALLAQRKAGALWDIEAHPLSLRAGQAMHGLWFYVWKTLAPWNLIPLYEQDPGARALDTANLGGLLFAGGMSLLAWAMRRRAPALTACWTAYVVMIAPMLGLAQSGPQVVADRYSYVACLPWALLAGAAMAEWLRRSTARQERDATRKSRAGMVPSVALGVVTALLASLTFRQTAAWADSHTLWTTVIARAPRTGLAHANLAVVLLSRGDAEGAITHAREALSILPGNLAAHRALGQALLARGDGVTEAVRHLEIAAAMTERLGRLDAVTFSLLAESYARSGRPDDAVRVYQRLRAADPTDAGWPFAAGSVLAAASRFGEAAAMFQRAIELDPRHVEAHFRLGVVLERLGRREEAERTWHDGAQLAPDDERFRAKIGGDR